jgi:hypothetical protein
MERRCPVAAACDASSSAWSRSISSAVSYMAPR